MKIKWLVSITLCLLCWTSTGISNHYNAVKSDDAIMYALFKDRFTEPMEVMYFLMNDMRLLKATSNDETKISLRIWDLERKFKSQGYEISDVIVIIHNHTKRAYFSTSDIEMYKIFRGMGFEGKFYIYVERNKTIYELAEKYR